MANKKLQKLRNEVMKYRYVRDGGFGVSADVAGNELRRIALQHGHLSSKMVVDEARPDDAVLHPAFEWNDEVAAERFRLQQASTLVRAVVVVAPENNESHRAYMLTTIDTEPRPVYVDAETVVDSPSMFADSLGRLERRLQEAKRSVEELRGLAKQSGAEPERMARIGLAITAIEAAGAAIAALH